MGEIRVLEVILKAEVIKDKAKNVAILMGKGHSLSS